MDESLKYHEVQKAKLEDLEKTVGALKVEKEALLAELAGWRECLDASSAQVAPADVLEASILQGDATRIGSSDLASSYDSIPIPGPVTTHEMPVMASVNYNTQANAIPNPMPDVQLLDNYALQPSGVLLANDPGLNALPRTSQYHLTQGGTRDDLHQHPLWSAPQSSHMQQSLWTQPSYQDLPLEFQHHQFPDQGYNLHTG